MSQYVKPTIKFASIALNSSALGSCSIASDDLELIQSIVGGDDISQTFGMQEECAIKIPLEMYCKFTSSELGAAQAFIS